MPRLFHPAFRATGPDATPPCPAPPGPIATGDPDGHPVPLGASVSQARAGRLRADQLPDDPDGLLTWAGGDFVLANDRVALIIEDAGDSEGAPRRRRRRRRSGGEPGATRAAGAQPAGVPE